MTPGNAATQSVAPTAQAVTQAAQVGPPASQPITPAAQPESVKPNLKTGKIAGTCLVILMLVGFGIFVVFLLGKSLLSKIDLSIFENILPTPGTALPLGSGPEGYQYWQGDIPNSYYRLNFDGERARQVTGKPYMVLK